MARFQDLLCRNDERRQQIRAADTLHGLDYLEVRTEPPSENQRVLELHFISKTTLTGAADLDLLLDDLDGHPERFAVTGGVRVPDVQVTEAVRAGTRIDLTVNHPGDFSPYVLTADHPRLDPVFRSLEFNFKAGCPNPFDCLVEEECPPEPMPEPAIDYMAKDYASFRQALLDRISVLNPRWRERNAADLGIALVELLAYAGDHLSYYQDAVATEAFLETARQRISVRRHARLIDYRMHDGLSARTFVFFHVAGPGIIPAGTQVLVRVATPSGELLPRTIPPAEAENARSAAPVIFEVESDITANPLLNRIELHEWAREDCCLPRGATSADLVGNLVTLLRAGDFLLLEEGAARRQVVRLVHAESVQDPLTGDVLTRVHWDAADALAYPFCISNAGTAGLTVARGNIALAHHGRLRQASHDVVAPDASRLYRFKLEEGPVSFWIRSSPNDPASALLLSDPRKSVPQVDIENWIRRDTLLESDPTDAHFVVEVDNEGAALLRFGDGVAGRKPDAGTLHITYRTGIGPSGNIAADSLYHAIPPGVVADWPGLNEVRNPLAAWGGTDPQSLEEVKLTAPAALRAETFRAVTEDDYSKAAEALPEVSKAVAQFRWTGTWHTVFLTIDPAGATSLAPETRDRIEAHIRSYLQTGYDLKINSPVFVPLEIDLTVCVEPDRFRSDVYQALLSALGTGKKADGTLAFFHPDRFTFGQPLYLSQLYAAAGSVPGVRSVQATRFQRLGRAPNQELENGLIKADQIEVLRLDNDPNFAENGVLRIHLEGGK